MTSTTLKTLEVVLRNFNLQELCDIALQGFPEITWDEVQNIIIAHGEALICKNVIKVLVNTVKDVSKDEIENRISNLYLLAVGKSSKRTWIAFKLLDGIPVKEKDKLENIRSTIRGTGMLASTNMTKFNNKYVLSIEKKIISKKRGLRKQLPIYFQFFSNEPYLFCSRKTIENKIMSSVVEALGYSKWKLCNLSGPNITDLLQLLKNKKSAVDMPPHLLSEPQPTITVTDGMANLCQKEKRKRYAEQIYGEKPAQLQSFSVSLKNSTWVQTDEDFDKMNGASLDGVNLTLRAKNIAEFFKEMISVGAVSEPIPEYMRALVYTGKNNLKITRT